MQKLFAGLLLTLGFVFLLVPVSVMFTKNPSQDDKSAALGGIAIGVPALAGGLVMVKGMRKNTKESLADRERRLEATFLELIQANNGQVATINFAIATKLPLAEAKEYLDKKATQLNGDFEVMEDGKICYRFHL